MEDMELLLAPMVEDAKEAVGSMGDDTPLAVLSDRYRPLSHFFRQNFSQVTNPPIDSLRELAEVSGVCIRRFAPEGWRIASSSGCGDSLYCPNITGGPADGLPVAWYAAHRSGCDYAAFLCGVDYRHVRGTEFGAYRQMLRAMIGRAAEVGRGGVSRGERVEGIARVRSRGRAARPMRAGVPRARRGRAIPGTRDG